MTSATGCEVRTARSSALTLRSRPTWSGTIISGKMTVSRSATSGRTWTRSRLAPSPRRPTFRVDLGIVLGLVSCHGVLLLQPMASAARGSSCGLRRIALHRSHRTDRRPGSCRGFELKDDPHAGEVDSLPAGEETNDTNALDVRLAVETEVVSSLWAEEALLLVDAQRAGMAARQLRGDADDVSRAGQRVAARERRSVRAPRAAFGSWRDHKP